jgi:hypothetical protein
MRKPDNLKFGSNKTKGHKQDSQTITSVHLVVVVVVGSSEFFLVSTGIKWNLKD